MDPFMVRMLTASVLAADRIQNAETAQYKGKSILDLSHFTQSKEGMVTVAFRRSLLHIGTFINVTDDLRDVKRYQYTGGVPTYRELPEFEATKLVMDWLQRFFLEVPKEVDTPGFFSGEYSASIQKYTLKSRRSQVPLVPGIYFYVLRMKNLTNSQVTSDTIYEALIYRVSSHKLCPESV